MMTVRIDLVQFKFRKYAILCQVAELHNVIEYILVYKTINRCH